MGHRLFIKYVKNGETILSTYHHWEACNMKSIRSKKRQIVSQLKRLKKMTAKSIGEMLVSRFCMAADEECKKSTEMFDTFIEGIKKSRPLDKDKFGRNEGLLMFYPEKELNKIIGRWAEGLVLIDITDIENIIGECRIGRWNKQCLKE